MATNDKLKAALSRIRGNLNVQMNIGILSGSTNEDTGEPIAPYAAANEFGTRNIPPRPFMRSTIANKSGEWGQAIGALLQGNAQDSDRVESAFNILGMTIVQDIKDTIEQGVSPPNHPTTVAAKAHKGRAEPNKTLIDTGSMQRAIAHEIIKGGGIKENPTPNSNK
ncbi:hypothetical protein [Xenorhabdus hominickii]|uniref:Bacteriophage protein n=1 Tax=Xenorhabdus hominickii TaxID=351679 RepID=A0A2G0Q633_XENHO|nr:hypothetical protein [Xenorhabdus hominickii]AOM39549.1 hypothetical protein A9255_02415 [Xenorhabdus hominickii]PHM54677.1 bacteriophage protein [Xenorhabdus hominickii]